MTITINQLNRIMPNAATDACKVFLEEFNTQLPAHQIDTPLRIAAFIAQGAHESGELRELVEKMGYTKPERLMEVWPSRFPNKDFAMLYINNPSKLGSFVYANRMGNGDEASGDGYK